MARQTKIVDFDGARTASGSRRARNEGARTESRARKSSHTKREAAVREDEASLPRSRRSSSADSERARSSARSERRTSRGGSDKARGTRSDERQRREGDDSNTSTRSRSTRSSSRATRAENAREQRRRSKNKARADKAFDKRFAADAASQAEFEDSPRAAVYEGKADSVQRKAVRMVRASEAGPVSAKINPAGWLSNVNISARSARIATVLICLVLTCVFLYIPAQHYYQSVREHDRLEAEYAVIEKRNAALDEQNDSLAGDAGMEDAVRQKYGYIVKGDQTAVVTGLSDTTTDTSRDSEGIEANVLSSTVKAPEEWYTPYLDAFFGVS